MIRKLGDEALSREIVKTSKSISKDAKKKIKRGLLNTDTLEGHLDVAKNQYSKIVNRLYSARDESIMELENMKLDLKSNAEQKLSTLRHEADKLRIKYKDYQEAAKKANKDIMGEESSLVTGAESNVTRLMARLEKVTGKKGD